MPVIKFQDEELKKKFITACKDAGGEFFIDKTCTNRETLNCKLGNVKIEIWDSQIIEGEHAVLIKKYYDVGVKDIVSSIIEIDNIKISKDKVKINDIEVDLENEKVKGDKELKYMGLLF